MIWVVVGVAVVGWAEYGWPVGAAVLAAGYALACWLWPFALCSHCDAGRRKSPTGKHHGRCWWCRGTPERLRLGRKVFNFFSSRRRKVARR